MYLVKIGGVKHLIDVEENKEFIAHAGETIDEFTTGGFRRVRCLLNVICCNPHHAGYGVDIAAHYSRTDVHDYCSRFRIDFPGIESEKDTEIDDWDDRSPQVAHAGHIWGHVRNPCDTRGNDDLPDLLDPECVFLAADFQADDLLSTSGRSERLSKTCV